MRSLVGGTSVEHARIRGGKDALNILRHEEICSRFQVLGFSCK